MSAIKVRLIGGYQTCNERQCATVWGLGLNKLGDERLLPDNPAILGMAKSISHLVVWERVAENPPAPKKRRRHAKRAKSGAAQKAS
jgi:ribosomal protein L30